MKKPILICVQKFHPEPKVHSLIRERINREPGLSAVFQNNALWSPGDTITISFENDGTQTDCSLNIQWYSLDDISDVLTDSQMDIEKRARAQSTYSDAVKLVVQELVQPAVPTLTLKFVDSDGDVRVSFGQDAGSHSIIGTLCKQSVTGSTMNFGWMDVGTIVHEFSHVLGMLHEHQSPFNNPIEWNRSAVYAWAAETQGWNQEETDINILDTFPTNEVSGSTFDPKSIMLYFFPSNLTLNGYTTGQNLRFSQTDLDFLNIHYGKNGQTNAIYTPTKGTLSVDSVSLIPSFISCNSKLKEILIICGIIVLVIIIIILAWKILSSRPKVQLSQLG